MHSTSITHRLKMYFILCQSPKTERQKTGRENAEIRTICNPKIWFLDMFMQPRRLKTELINLGTKG